MTITPPPPATDDLEALPVTEHIDLLRRMIEVREFEEKTHQLFTRALVRGSTHLCSGQEAVTVGACAVLSDGDSMVCTYRGHGAVLAMGAPLDRSFAEILGRADGLCAGKGGSMHLTDVSVGAYGSFAVVGAHLPVATGLGFAAVYSGTQDVCVCFFGEGSTNIGAFHEALNLASIWSLPVVYICENNLYGEYTHMAKTTPVASISARAASYGMRTEQVDGNDLTAVYRAVERAVDHGRAGQGPTLLEALTYRHKGHSRSDPAKYRPAGELEAWLARDPIAVSEVQLRAAGAGDDQLAQARESAVANVQGALDRALASPEPTLESRFEDVLA